MPTITFIHPDNRVERVEAEIGDSAMRAAVLPERQANSRLSCQIKITPQLDGLVLRLPERQV